MSRLRAVIGWLSWESLILAGLAAAFLGVFLQVSDELFDGEVDAVDGAILAGIAALRGSPQNDIVAAITWVGALPVLFAVCTVAGVLLLRAGDRLGCAQLIGTAISAGLLVRLTKLLVARERPDLALRIAEVTGYSYPSGHAMGATAVFLGLALVLRRHVASRRHRLVVHAVAGFVILAVAFSRVYLGVHYTTDVVSGVAFAAAWTLAIAAIVAWVRQRARR
jgi:undecaprenyl-diphosphatase